MVRSIKLVRLFGISMLCALLRFESRFDKICYTLKQLLRFKARVDRIVV
jgi:hypothetical protein